MLLVLTRPGGDARMVCVVVAEVFVQRSSSSRLVETMRLSARRRHWRGALSQSALRSVLDAKRRVRHRLVPVGGRPLSHRVGCGQWLGFLVYLRILSYTN